MCSGEGDWTCLQPGFPIRKSSDHSLVIDSPRLIADSYVLLRFLVPRHPPCALKNLSHKDARVHCVVLNIRAVPHHQPDASHHNRMRVRPQARSKPHGPEDRPSQRDARALRTQQRARRHPHTPLSTPPTPPQRRPEAVLTTHRTRRQLIDVPPMSTCRRTSADEPGCLNGHPTPTNSQGSDDQLLLRKEVIQPHLPVRLPCYDLVPIASPTFDGSLHKGWATGFGCYRLS